MITIISQDQVEFKITKDAAMMSKVIRGFLEDVDEDAEEEVVIPLGLDSNYLQKAVDYMNHHHDNIAEEIEKPLKGEFSSLVSEWDYKFVDVPVEELEPNIMAANYLDIKDMINLFCAKLVSLIRGKTPAEIRDVFGIENDLTPEEENLISEENKWCEEF